MAYKKSLLFFLISIVFLVSGCGTVMRSYRMHQVRCYTGDGKIERLNIVMIPVVYGEYGFKITLPEFTPENNFIRFYKLSEIPKVMKEGLDIHGNRWLDATIEQFRCFSDYYRME